MTSPVRRRSSAPQTPSRKSIFQAASFFTLTLALAQSACSGDDGDSFDHTGSASGGSNHQGSGGAFSSSGGSSSGGSNGMASGGSANLGPTDPSHVVVVAHQDDDLLFINPEMKRAMDRGEALTTVYITSGDAGLGMSYVQERELGIRSAYAFMADENNSWSCAPQNYAGKSVQNCSLQGSKDVSLVFFRLQDGIGDGTAAQSLQKLWRGQITQSAAVDSSGLSFTRDELLSSLEAVFSSRKATAIYTTDFAFENAQFDHSDHEVAALLTLAASGNYPSPHSLNSYITYSTTDWTINLSASEQAMVADTFAHYASCDSELAGCNGGASCDQMMCSTSDSLYQSWTKVFYFSQRASATQGQIQSQSAANLCLNSNGTSLSTATCSGATSWSYQDDLSLRDESGNCVTAASNLSSGSVNLAPCSGDKRQRWSVMDNGQIVLSAPPNNSDAGIYSSSFCLNAGWGSGANVTLSACGSESALKWSL